MFNFSSKNKGFTLVEIIIAILVVTVGVLATYIVVQEIISYTHQVSSRLTAAYLAQEGIEIVRNIRDTNWLQENGWDDGLNKSSDYRLDYQSSEFPDVNCNLGSEGYLKYDGDFYNCLSGQDTKFKREITITSVDGTLEVYVEVTWTEKGNNYGPITVQEILYNWY